MVDIPSFIKQKRQDGQNDSLILEELVALGSDRTEVLKQLASNVANPILTNQTGGEGVPVQAESVVYNIKVGKMRSRIGFAAFVCALCAWIFTWVSVYFLTNLRQAVFPLRGDLDVDVAGILVLTAAFLVPVIPLFIFTRKRLNGILDADPKNVDDISFKKSIRFHLVIGLLLALGWVIDAVYNVLAILFLKKELLTGGVVVDSIIYAVAFSALTYFFWTYHRQTKR